MSKSLLSTATVTAVICMNYITVIHSSALDANRQRDLPLSIGFNQRSPPELERTGEVTGREPYTVTGSQLSSSCSHDANGNGCAKPSQSPPGIQPENPVIISYPSRTGNALANRLAMHHQKPSTEDGNRGPVNLKTSRMISDVSLIFKFIHLIEALFNLLTATLWAN